MTSNPPPILDFQVENLQLFLSILTDSYLFSLQGRELRVTTFDFPPYVFKTTNPEISYSGVEVNILNAMAASLNFTPSFR